MGAKLPAEKLGELVLKAAEVVKADKSIAPEVADRADDYVTAFREATHVHQQNHGEHALITAAVPMYAAGYALRQVFGDPMLGTYEGKPDDLAGAVNTQDARTAVEDAMGQAYHEMLNPPDRH